MNNSPARTFEGDEGGENFEEEAKGGDIIVAVGGQD